MMKNIIAVPLTILFLIAALFSYCQADAPDAEALIKGLKSPNEQIRYESAQKLSQLRAPSSLKPLLNTAKSNDSLRVRLAAISALGKLKDRQSVPFLLSAVNRRELLPAAALALGRIGDERGIEPVIENSKYWEGCGYVLTLYGEKAVPALLKALKAKDDRIRLTAVKTLSEINPAGLFEALKPMTSDKNLRVKKAAERALKKLKP